MADTQNVIYAQTYGRNIMALAQQKMSKLYPHVYKKTVDGKTFFQDRIGEWEMALKTGRGTSTPLNDPEFSRRMGVMLDYNDARLLDKEDDLKIISDPKSAMTQAAGMSIGRQIDDIILTALIGTAYAGETGATSTVLPSAQKIANGSTGLTKAKMLQTKRILDEADVPDEDRIFVTSPQGLEDLLGTTEVASSDYNTVKALVQGDFDTWLGFKFIKSTRLAVSSNVRSCIAFQKMGLCLGEAASAQVRTDEREDLSYAWQVYYSVHMGAVRLEEERVVQVDILES